MTPRPLAERVREMRCNHCGAKPGERCVTSSGRTTPRAHTLRHYAYWDTRPELRR